MPTPLARRVAWSASMSFVANAQWVSSPPADSPSLCGTRDRVRRARMGHLDPAASLAVGNWVEHGPNLAETGPVYITERLRRWLAEQEALRFAGPHDAATAVPNVAGPTQASLGAGRWAFLPGRPCTEGAQRPSKRREKAAREGEPEGPATPPTPGPSEWAPTLRASRARPANRACPPSRRPARGGAVRGAFAPACPRAIPGRPAAAAEGVQARRARRRPARSPRRAA